MSDDTSMDTDDGSVDDLRVPVSGVFSMPASEGASEAQCMLTREDMQREMPSLVGAPVRVEHGGEVVGSVEKVSIDDEDRIAGTIRLNRDFSGRKALRACRDGKYKGFSLGIMHTPDVDEDGMPIITDKLLLHVALAEDPEFGEQTTISEVGQDRREVKLAKRFIKIAADKLRRRAVLEKQTDQNTAQKVEAQVSTTERLPRPHPIVTVSSKSSVPSTETMSSAEEIERQIAELQAKQKQVREQEEQKKKQQEEQKNTEEVNTDEQSSGNGQTMSQQQQQAPGGGFQPDGSWQQKPPNSYQSPVVFNMHLGGQGGQTAFDPLSQMSEASAAEYKRQQRDAEEYQRRRQFEPVGRGGQKRGMDADTEDAVSLVPKQDEKDREIARLQALLGEKDGKNRRFNDEDTGADEAEGSRASQTTRDLMSSIQNKLTQGGSKDMAEDVDPDADVDDKLLAKQAAEETDVDAASITFDELSQKNNELKKAAREINEFKSKIRGMKAGTMKQNMQDALATKQRKYEAACSDYVRRNNAWLMRQITLAGQDVDEDMEETMADYATQVGGLKLNDLHSLNNMGKLVTVSHANAENGLRQTNEQLAKAKREFAKERLRLQNEAERQRIEADRAKAAAQIVTSDPRSGARGGAPKVQGRPHTQPKHAASSETSAAPALDPRLQYMRQTGISMPLVDFNEQIPAGAKVFESKNNPSNMNFVPVDDRHRYRPPRARMGAQRSVDFDILKELDRTRRSHRLGQADIITRSDFGGHYTQPPGSVPLEGRPGLAKLPDHI